MLFLSISVIFFATERMNILSRIFDGIYARTSKNLFFIALHCGATNAQKISMSIRRQPSSSTQQRNKMQCSNDGECDINQLRPHRESLTWSADNEINAHVQAYGFGSFANHLVKSCKWNNNIILERSLAWEFVCNFLCASYYIRINLTNQRKSTFRYIFLFIWKLISFKKWNLFERDLSLRSENNRTCFDI